MRDEGTREMGAEEEGERERGEGRGRRGERWEREEIREESGGGSSNHI